MGGIDALLGYDYQVSYVTFKLIQILKDKKKLIDKFVFESINEGEEDFNIYYKNGRIEYIQIKKRREGKLWTPSDFKSIFQHYIKNYTDDTSFVFITNGSANDDVNKLKKYLKGEKKRELSKAFIEKFRPDDCLESDFVRILNSVEIKTLFMVSDDDDVSERLQKESITLLSGSSFLIKDDISNVYDRLWKYVFNLSKNGSHIKFSDFVRYTEQIKIFIIESREWLRFPVVEGFVGRKKELNELKHFVSCFKITSIFGISGIGKSYIMSTLAKELSERKDNVCWISCRANLNFDKLIKILGTYIEAFTGQNMFYEMLKNKEIGNQIDLLCDVFKQYECILFFDSYEIVNGNMRYLINEIVKKIDITYKTSFVFSTTNRNQLYNETDLEIGLVKEYCINEFSYEDFIEFYKSIGIDENKCNQVWKFIGGFPFANSMFKNLLLKNIIAEVDFSKLLLLSREEKNQWLFEKIYDNLEDTEKRVLSYLATIDYGFGDYEIIIIEKAMKAKIHHILKALINKNMIMFDGEVFYIHNVMRDLAYENIHNDEKSSIHELFINLYGEKLFSPHMNNSDRFLSIKWANHICKMYDMGLLGDKKLVDILSLSSQNRFDLWGILKEGYPFEFEDSSLDSIENRIGLLENQEYIHKGNEEWKWKINSHKLKLKELYLIEYKVLMEYDSLAMGYIPIFTANFGHKEQANTLCRWEHCIEYCPLEIPHNSSSCIIFGHNCPGGKEQVTMCKNRFSSDSEINEVLRNLSNNNTKREAIRKIKRKLND